tara:strand:+ start:14727 stop:15110 length:384 start_codon:yes stop_codon:yes gene_type:complete
MSKKWTETEVVLLKNCIEDGYSLVRIQEQFFQNGYKRTVGSLKYKVNALGLELIENETYQSVTDTVQDEMIGDLTKVDEEIRKTVDKLTKNVGMVNRRVTVYRNRSRMLLMLVVGVILVGGVLYVIG